ncbi:MAG: hypothetical protein JXA23_12370, partial [Bacteroidales bacterium]|nr:hypothetical protein [Bacteroidales bacterium]
MKKGILYCFLLITSSLSLHAQYFSTGQDPASYRWMQLKTDSFQIIFPRHLENMTDELATALHLIAKAETNTLQTRVPRMPFIFHPGSVVSNGITIWAPRRIELYPCPPPDIYPEPWIEQLAIHEYRHAVQVSKMNQGFTKALYYLFGEQATGAILGLYLPSWFLEGDATVTETALSSSGRGRMPSFAAPLRAQLLQKGIYSFDQATLGSYKTFIPDNYTLGYFLVASSRQQYGWELWDQTLDRVAKYPFMVVPFNSGIRAKTGKWKNRLYRETMESLLRSWQAEEDATWKTPMYRITQLDPSNYSSYDRPQFLNDSTLVALRISNEGVSEVVAIPFQPGNRIPETVVSQRLYRAAAYQTGSLSVAHGLVAWTEFNPDIRWQNRSYSVIKLRNPDSKFQPNSKSHVPNFRNTGSLNHSPGIQLTQDPTKHPSYIPSPLPTYPHSRFFSPAISPSELRIATTSISEDNQSYLLVLD